jgi:hypothetical protein
MRPAIGAEPGIKQSSWDGAPESPIGDAVAVAAAEGYVIGGKEQEPEPYLGYYLHCAFRTWIDVLPWS